MKNIQNLTIDINKKPFQTITANVGEVASRFIRINITDKSIPIDLTGVTVFLYAKKPDGNKVFNNVTIEDKTNGIILAELTSQILAIEGLVKLTLLLVKNNSKLCTKQFILNIDSSIVDDKAIESTNEFGALNNAISQVQEWNNYFEETSGKIEEKYAERLNDNDGKINALNKTLNNKTDNNKVIYPSEKVYIAHRGYSALYPENTILAFEQARREGFWGIENDIRLSSDNEFILMHDDTVDRTTDGVGSVSNLTLSQIKNLNITGGNFVEVHNTLKVPTLDEFFKVCAKGIVGICELKCTLSYDLGKKYIDLIKNNGVENKIITTSYDLENIKLLSSIDDTLSYGIIKDTPDIDFLDSLSMFNSLTISTLKTTMNDTDLINEIRKRGYKLLTYTAYQHDVGLYDYNQANGIISDYKLF